MTWEAIAFGIYVAALALVLTVLAAAMLIQWVRSLRSATAAQNASVLACAMCEFETPDASLAQRHPYEVHDMPNDMDWRDVMLEVER